MSESPLERESRKFAHLTAVGPTTLRGDGNPAWLHQIVVNKSAAATISIYNNPTSGFDEDLVAEILSASSASGRRVFFYDIPLNKGLTLSLGSADFDITVIYE